MEIDQENQLFKEHLKLAKRVEALEDLLGRFKEFQVQNNRDIMDIKKILKKDGKWNGLVRDD
jgi:hypothetical protein